MCDYLVMVARIVDAEACGRMALSEIEAWAARAVAMARRWKK